MFADAPLLLRNKGQGISERRVLDHGCLRGGIPLLTTELEPVSRVTVYANRVQDLVSRVTVYANGVQALSGLFKTSSLIIPWPYHVANQQNSANINYDRSREGRAAE